MSASETRETAPSEPRRHLVWAKGGHAEVVRVAGEAIVVRSTTPAPPGARLEATLADEPPATLKMKSHGSKREGDGAFRIEGRLIEVTRELRERVAALVAPG